MALVFNPPPNWPAPPAGWAPTPTWRPDPAWGPVPEGWQLWVEEPEPEPIQVEEATIEPLIPKEPAAEAAPAAQVVEAPAAESAEDSSGSKPMRHLTQVPLAGVTLPEQVLASQSSALSDPAVSEPVVSEPVAEPAAEAVEAPVVPAVSEPAIAEPVAEVTPEVPAAAEPVAEGPVAEVPASTEEAAHTIESSPLVKFHTPETERTVNLSERPGQNAQGDQNAAFIPAGQVPNGFHPNQADGFQGQNFQGGQNVQGSQYQNNPYQGQPYNAQQPYAGQVSGQDQATVALSNPYGTEPAAQGKDNSQKKGLFSGTKIWGVIGGVLALLIVIILAIVMLFPRGGSTPTSDSSKSASTAVTSSEASSPEASSAAPVAAAEAKMPEGEFKEYKKTITDNKDTIEIEKLKGDVSTGLLYYEFKSADGVVNAFISSRDEKGNNSAGVSVIDSTRDGKDLNGTAWIDASGHSTPTRKLELTGKGEWTIRVYDADSAPHYKKGEKFQSTMNHYAFTYEGTEATMEFQTSGPTSRGFSVLNATKNDPFFSSTMSPVKGSIQWVQNNKSYLQVRTDSTITWSIGTN